MVFMFSILLFIATSYVMLSCCDRHLGSHFEVFSGIHLGQTWIMPVKFTLPI